jgi:hypothetical protein
MGYAERYSTSKSAAASVIATPSTLFFYIHNAFAYQIDSPGSQKHEMVVDHGAADHPAGVFDYWGCPARLGDAVIEEIQSFIARGRREPVSALRSN